jgi:hypothetical protein
MTSFWFLFQRLSCFTFLDLNLIFFYLRTQIKPSKQKNKALKATVMAHKIHLLILNLWSKDCFRVSHTDVKVRNMPMNQCCFAANKKIS